MLFLWNIRQNDLAQHGDNLKLVLQSPEYNIVIPEYFPVEYKNPDVSEVFKRSYEKGLAKWGGYASTILNSLQERLIEVKSMTKPNLSYQI